MLKRVGHPVDEKGAAVAIKDAHFRFHLHRGLNLTRRFTATGTSYIPEC